MVEEEEIRDIDCDADLGSWAVRSTLKVVIQPTT
jgi:hypothetical protein